MREQRFGDVLRRFVPLSRHDIDEVLEEQSGERLHRRFGEIALSMGLCRPEHVWQAWCHQLMQHSQRVNLNDIGIDSQATMHLTATLAREYRAVPIRTFGDQIVVAVDDASHDRAALDLPGLLKMQVLFVITESKQIDAALDEYYALSPQAEDRAECAA